MSCRSLNRCSTFWTPARRFVVLLADDLRRERARGGGQRIDRRVDPELGDRPFEDDRRVEMREGGGWRRIGQVVGRHVHRLERRDRSFLRRRDPLLQQAHFGGQRRLVADGARGAAEQRRHFGSRLREAEDVVDEEQHVLVLLVAEVLGDRQAAQRHAQPRAGRLVHLPVDERDLRRAEILLVDDARLGHLLIEIVAFARPFADAGEHRDAAVQLRDVVDQLHDDDGLADAGAAERADLAALQERADQIDDLDAGRQHLRRGRLIDQRRRRPMNRIALLGLHRTALVHRIAGDVEHAAHHPVADRHRDRTAGVGDLTPRLSPSVPDIEIVRTQLSPRCCCTSSVSLHRLLLDRRSPRSTRCRSPAARRQIRRRRPDRRPVRLYRCS